METRSIEREVEVPTTPRQTFELLITPSAIRAWWSVARAIVVPRAGGFWAATWGADEDRPDYVMAATIEVFEPLRRLVLGDYRYAARTGALPFEMDARVAFEVRPTGHGSLLHVCQTGIPAEAVADEYHAGCERGWSETLRAFQRHARATLGG